SNPRRRLASPPNPPPVAPAPRAKNSYRQFVNRLPRAPSAQPQSQTPVRAQQNSHTTPAVLFASSVTTHQHTRPSRNYSTNNRAPSAKPPRSHSVFPKTF